MKGFLAVFKKEMYTFMASPIFVVVAFIFLLLVGYFFYSSVMYYSMLSFQAAQNPYMAPDLNITNMVVRPFFGNMTIIMLFLFPLLTMRLFSEEKKTGTVELLFTLPIKGIGLSMGKYAATLSIFAIMSLGTIPIFMILQSFGELDWGIVWTCWLGIFLLASAFTALGMFVSSLTENQIIAGSISFGVLLLFWLLGWIESYTGGITGTVATYLAILGHIDNLLKGLIDSRDILYYVFFTVFFLFCTLRTLDSKKWRS